MEEKWRASNRIKLTNDQINALPLLKRSRYLAVRLFVVVCFVIKLYLSLDMRANSERTDRLRGRPNNCADRKTSFVTNKVGLSTERLLHMELAGVLCMVSLYVYVCRRNSMKILPNISPTTSQKQRGDLPRENSVTRSETVAVIILFISK